MSQNQNRRGPVSLDGLRQHGTTLKGTTPLADDHQVEAFGPEALNCLSVGGAGTSLISVVLENCGVVQKVPQIFVHQEQLRFVVRQAMAPLVMTGVRPRHWKPPSAFPQLTGIVLYAFTPGQS